MTHEELKALEPEILDIIKQFPNERDAAPVLRKLAKAHGHQRHRVFGAYRVLKQRTNKPGLEETRK